MDPRSRYFDPTDPDGPPMPYDDPASHLYMHCVAGKKGYPCWHMNGDWYDLENPLWKRLLTQYNQVNKDGTVKLTMNGSVCLAQVHSSDYRTQIETIYLSALDVSTERFRFDVQFFGDSTTAFSHVGPNGPPGPQGQATATHPETNTLDVRRRQSGDKTYLLQKEFSTGGELLVGFANSFVWQFAGPNSGVTSSLLNFSFVQPLLRNGGRVFIMETLTRAERNLLANLRAFQRYRQGFYAAVTVGNSSVGGRAGPAAYRWILGQHRSDGLHRHRRRRYRCGGGRDLRHSEQRFRRRRHRRCGHRLRQRRRRFGRRVRRSAAAAPTGAQRRGKSQRIIANPGPAERQSRRRADRYRSGRPVPPADRVRPGHGLERQVAYQLQLDAFKAGLLGLPPDVAIEPDDSMLDQFRFLDPRTSDVQHMIDDFVKVVGQLPAEPSSNDIQRSYELLATLRDKVGEQFTAADTDMKKLDAATPERKKNMTARQIEQFDADRKRLEESLADVRTRFEQTQGTLANLENSLGDPNHGRTADNVVALATHLSGLVQELALIKARARVETITIPSITLPSDRALEIARANRLDWMNNRAQLVDSWRLISFQAQQLKAGLDLTFSGDLGTIGNNPAAFNGNNGDLRVGVAVRRPVHARGVERNNYRSVLITYQQTRRSLYQFQDGVNFNLRNLLRTLDQLQVNMEIQRRAVVIAIRRVDKTREDLNRPPAPVLPGQQPESLGPTVGLNLISALNDLQAAQNTFMSVVLNHLENRMLLYRELGTMELDNCGMWIDRPIEDADWLTEAECPMPPAVPVEWLKDAGIDPSELNEIAPEHEKAAPGNPFHPLDGMPARLVKKGDPARQPARAASHASKDQHPASGNSTKGFQSHSEKCRKNFPIG